jgi:hypothetical protein
MSDRAEEIRAEFEHRFDIDWDRCTWDGQRYQAIDEYDPDDVRTAAAFTLALTAWQAAQAQAGSVTKNQNGDTMKRVLRGIT